jgi:hypothetical protein
MFRFGVTNFATFFMSFAYIAVSVIIIFISYNYLAGIDWSREIQFQFFGGPAEESGTPVDYTGF